MATESIQGLRYPLPADPNDPPTDFKNLADDVVTRTNMRFASTGARDAAVTSPVAGMECFVGSGSTAIKYIYFNGAWKALYQGPQSWSPSLVNVTLGTGGTATGRFQAADGVCHFSALITLGTGGALTGGFGTNLPVNRRTDIAQDPIGQVWLRDTSASTNRAWLLYGSNASGAAIISPDGSFVTASSPWTWAVGDTIAIRGTYEVA